MYDTIVWKLDCYKIVIKRSIKIYIVRYFIKECPDVDQLEKYIHVYCMYFGVLLLKSTFTSPKVSFGTSYITSIILTLRNEMIECFKIICRHIDMD